MTAPSTPRPPAGTAQTTDAEDHLPLARQFKPATWIVAVAVLVLVGMFVHMLVTNENIQWPTVMKYMFDSRILNGIWVTLELTAISLVIGFLLGLVIALMQLSSNRVLKTVAAGWIWFFRGVPPLVQLLFWYNAASMVPNLSLGIPFGPEFVSWDTNSIMTPFGAALFGLALTESGYAAEIFRSGIQAVDRGQRSAGLAIGMTESQVMRRVILPVAVRIILPPLGNQLVSMLKTTSLVSVLAMPELLYSAQQIYSYTFETIPLLIVATLWYLVLMSLATVGLSTLERNLSKKAPAMASR